MIRQSVSGLAKRSCANSLIWSAIGRKTVYYTFSDRAPCERPSMPELPEVETVRRGLQPVMEGSRIVKMEVRRKDLRFPFQRDFVARLTGQTVTGLGRRAKYLMADLGSGDVLVMHLGMSGSFRVAADDGHATPGRFQHPVS